MSEEGWPMGGRGKQLHTRGVRAWLAGVGLLMLLSQTQPAWAIESYQVQVLSEDPTVLSQIQTQVPDAYLVITPDQTVILAGTFLNRIHAEKRRQALAALGVSVRVVAVTPGDPPLTPAVPPSPLATSLATPLPGTLPERRYRVIVAVPTSQGEELTNQVKRFFPQAQPTTYQGEAALQTGSFSQLAQAQDQVSWLAAQGIPAMAVATASPPASSSPVSPQASPPQTGEEFWVLVADPTGEQLDLLQAQLPQAVPLLYDDLQVVKTGGFASESEAQAQLQTLAQLGYEAGVFPADLRRSQPILADLEGSSPTPSTMATAPSPPATSPPSAEGAWWVIVTDISQLAQVQVLAPDAFIRPYQNRSVIQVGTYRLRQNAEQALKTLMAAGLAGQIVDPASP
ncbi:MAG: sporulation protein [Cyanobacteriota bacterium]|nr:sporulation protein [Cyanobacteriota bacterium]